MDDPLVEARARIDALDLQVLALLAERASLTEALRAWKAARALPLRDDAREAAMIAARRREAERLGLSPWLAEVITRAVLATTRGLGEEDRAALARGP